MANSEQRNQLRANLLTSPEGRLLLIGVALALAYTLWLTLKLLLSPEDSQDLVGMTATHLMFGRAASMAFGYSQGLDHNTVVPVGIVIETVMVLIFYPLFVFSWRRLLVIRRLRRMFERTRRAAESHKDTVRRYGIAGLFVFVWFPFWMTGPVVGSVIGFMLGLRTWLNMTVVLAGTYVAILGWAFLLRELHERVASYSSYAAMVLIALLVIIILAGNRLLRTYRHNKNKC